MADKGQKKVLVALSGGVDSAVAALRLLEQGWQVAGAYMRTWMDEKGSGILASCPWEEDIAAASAVARHLGIEFEVVNLIKHYREHVVHYLIEGYRHGQTPNPDIMCNRQIKFGVLREYALEHGFDALATGHYARLTDAPDGRAVLEGVDPDKDQSYFLAMARREHLRQVLFPIGELQKHRVRELAAAAGLPNAQRKDSQGICFLGKVDIRDFLAQYIGEEPGPIVHALDGRVLGEHQGLHRYTIGQRKGIGIPSNQDNENYVVVGKDVENNQLRVAFESARESGLFTREATVHGFNWLAAPITDACELEGRVRYRDPRTRFHFEPTGEDQARLYFEEEQRGLATGQTLALYQGERLLGGAWFGLP